MADYFFQRLYYFLWGFYFLRRSGGDGAHMALCTAAKCNVNSLGVALSPGIRRQICYMNFWCLGITASGGVSHLY